MGEARAWRFPIAFGDQELHGFEPLLPLRIVAIAHADEAVTVLCEELCTREVEDLGERRGGVARAEGPSGAIDEARLGEPAGLGS